jgi:ribonuclease Z
VQTQDLTVFNITKDAVLVRQAKVIDHLPPTAGVPAVEYKPVEHAPPDWWKDALIPLE